VSLVTTIGKVHVVAAFVALLAGSLHVENVSLADLWLHGAYRMYHFHFYRPACMLMAQSVPVGKSRLLHGTRCGVVACGMLVSGGLAMAVSVAVVFRGVEWRFVVLSVQLVEVCLVAALCR
jgi:hypothetical protein